MPAEGLHLAISLFIIASCMSEDELKPAIALIPFGLLCDLDSLFGVHRATLHNVFIIALPLIFMAVPQARNKVKIRWLALAATLIASHILLDAFYNGVFLFYPLSVDNYNLRFWFGLKETGPGISFSWFVPGDVREVHYAVKPSPSVPEIPIISNGTELIILISAILSFSIRFVRPFNLSRSQ